MINQEVKGNLAKLLATENLTVEHRKVTTAYFDVDKRILCLPIWKSASNTVYDLLVGHEVGHALHTPNEDISGVSKSFMNVLEDARVERLMKQTYPGLRKSFYEGYKELWEQDFFGVKSVPFNELSLIDRINLYFKGNAEMPFSDEEMVWVNEAANTKTFSDVLDLARRLWEYANQKQEEKESQEFPEVSGNLSDGESQVTPTSESDDTGDNSWESNSPTEGTNGGLEEDLEYGDSKDENQFIKDETESITDAFLKKSLENLVDDNAKEWVYLNLPNPDVNKYIVSHKEISEDLSEFYSDTDDRGSYYQDCLQYATNNYLTFKKDTQKSVNYLVKQFEMRKSADEYKRSATSKTGVINTNALHKYKMTDDIFKKVAVIPEGKNHGLIMFLDWSGSMQNHLVDTLRQTYNLIWFCKKSGIPFRVYGFQNGYYDHDVVVDQSSLKDNELSIVEGDFKLLEFFSSQQNSKSLEESMRLVYLQAFAMGGTRLSYMSKYNLGGTPLSESVMCARKLVSNLKKVERVTKVNVICLTDGESNPMAYVKKPKGDYGTYHHYLCHNFNKVFILRDPVTGYTRKLSQDSAVTTREIVSFHREITNYNWIGIRICSKHEAFRIVRDYCPEKQQSLEKQWKTEKFISVSKSTGFTEAFLIPSSGMSMESQDIVVRQKSTVATKAELARAFKKHMGSKMANKTVLNAFIETIA